jgi:hypothetical protein
MYFDAAPPWRGGIDQKSNLLWNPQFLLPAAKPQNIQKSKFYWTGGCVAWPVSVPEDGFLPQMEKMKMYKISSKPRVFTTISATYHQMWLLRAAFQRATAFQANDHNTAKANNPTTGLFHVNGCCRQSFTN